MILVTGGAGYIGSHACVAFWLAGEEGRRVRQFLQQSPLSLEPPVRSLGKSLARWSRAMSATRAALERVLANIADEVMHFAGLKSVQDLVAQPLEYYDHNVIGSHRLLCAMQNTGVKKIVFSSSATVYGTPQFLPYTEDHPLNAINPVRADQARHRRHAARPICQRRLAGGIAILRYFNPVGAHESGQNWRRPERRSEQSGAVRGAGRHRAPRAAQRVGQRLRHARRHRRQGLHPRHGSGRPGMCWRSNCSTSPKCYAVNLGHRRRQQRAWTWFGPLKSESGKRIPYDVKPRRPGDLAAYYAATDYAVEADGLESDPVT